MTEQAVTLRDVAARAGVHPATASRALNPETRLLVKEDTARRVLEAAELIPIESLGTTDDCGFSPFADDTSTSRETAFAKVKSRVEGTAMAAEVLGV